MYQEPQSSLSLIAAPVGEPLTLKQAYDHLIAPEIEDSDLIQSLITAARTYFEERDARRLCSQTWLLELSEFPCVIKLPYFPVQAISFVKYVDGDGDLQTLDPSAYIHYQVNEISYLAPVYNTYWPSSRCFPRSVRVQFVVGYGDAVTTPDPAFDGTNYHLSIEPNWTTKFGVSVKTDAGFHVNFDNAAPADAEIDVLAQGGTPLQTLAHEVIAIDEDTLSQDVVFSSTLATPSTIVGGIPEHIKKALLLHIGHMYANREDSVDVVMQKIPMGYEALIGSNRRLQV